MQRWFNNVSTALTTDVEASSTILPLVDGSAFSAGLNLGDWFHLTLDDGAGNVEIVKVMAVSGNSVSVARGQDGTIARNFLSGTTRVEHRLVAADIQKIAGDAAPIQDVSVDSGTGFLTINT